MIWTSPLLPSCKDYGFSGWTSLILVTLYNYENRTKICCAKSFASSLFKALNWTFLSNLLFFRVNINRSNHNPNVFHSRPGSAFSMLAQHAGIDLSSITSGHANAPNEWDSTKIGQTNNLFFSVYKNWSLSLITCNNF